MKELKNPVIQEISGSESGETVAILVGIHGNEQGPILEWDWLNSLQIKRGKVNLVFANPTASELNRRFVNINLNRRFGSKKNEFPEDKIARRIEKILDESLASLDLHMYNESMDRPFVICNEHSNELAKLLPAKYIINIPGGVVGGGTDDYMALNNKVGVCFETGSVERPRGSVGVIRRAVMAFLKLYNLIDEVPDEYETELATPTTLIETTTKYMESKNFKFAKDFVSFDKISKGKQIATENGQPIIAEEDSYILFPRPNNPIGAEAYYLLKDSSDNS